jgi:ring-1,2-phenylacetyl-CoA epoxidase subunit PaaD
VSGAALSVTPAPTESSERERAAWRVLDGVLDPEVPALSLVDLGIVRAVRPHGDTLELVLTPTYSGCPATEVIERSAVDALDAAGLGPVRVTLQRAPAWSSDWISAEGRRKLRDYGIAPPGPVDPAQGAPVRLVPRRASAAASVECPRCGSADTERLSAFGSTACKALYRCRACREPFEHFKPI